MVYYYHYKREKRSQVSDATELARYLSRDLCFLSQNKLVGSISKQREGQVLSGRAESNVTNKRLNVCPIVKMSQRVPAKQEATISLLRGAQG